MAFNSLKEKDLFYPEKGSYVSPASFTHGAKPPSAQVAENKEVKTILGIPIVEDPGLQEPSAVEMGDLSCYQRVTVNAPSLSEVDLIQGALVKCPNCLNPGHLDLTISSPESEPTELDPIWWNWHTEPGKERWECMRCWFRPL